MFKPLLSFCAWGSSDVQATPHWGGTVVPLGQAGWAQALARRAQAAVISWTGKGSWEIWPVSVPPGGASLLQSPPKHQHGNPKSWVCQPGDRLVKAHRLKKDGEGMRLKEKKVKGKKYKTGRTASTGGNRREAGKALARLFARSLSWLPWLSLKEQTQSSPVLRPDRVINAKTALE